MLRRLSQASGVQVIACTGFFQEPSPMLGAYTPKQFARLFIDDATRGIAGTDIRAGILKTAMDLFCVCAELACIEKLLAAK